MKKIILIICFLLITGCDYNKKNNSKIEEYYLKYNSVEIKTNTNFSNVIATLGLANNIRIEQSNYYDKPANIYEYDTFEIETYYDNSIEKIYSIRITSDEQKNNENVKIGDKKNKMISTYGKNYTKIEDNIFIYKLSNTNLSFTLENDIIKEIIYYIE